MVTKTFTFFFFRHILQEAFGVSFKLFKTVATEKFVVWELLYGGKISELQIRSMGKNSGYITGMLKKTHAVNNGDFNYQTSTGA